MSLAIAATDDVSASKSVSPLEARRQGIWVNIVDVPPLCDFIAPAIVPSGREIPDRDCPRAAPRPLWPNTCAKKIESIVGQEYADFR